MGCLTCCGPRDRSLFFFFHSLSTAIDQLWKMSMDKQPVPFIICAPTLCSNWVKSQIQIAIYPSFPGSKSCIYNSKLWIMKSVVIQNRFASPAEFKLQRKDSNRSALQGLLVWYWAWAIMPGPAYWHCHRLPYRSRVSIVTCFVERLMILRLRYSLQHFHPPITWSQESCEETWCYSSTDLLLIAPPDSPQFHWQPWGVILRPQAFATAVCQQPGKAWKIRENISVFVH